MAPVVRALRSEPWAQVRVMVTAQHRDLLDQTLGFFEIEPDLDLDLMQPDQPLADLTGRMIHAVDRILGNPSEQPDLVLAQGDTTTVMVTALCCFYRKIPFGHVEAGLRTRLKYAPFPEEMNRALVARLADLHFAPTERSRRNLLLEGVSPELVSVTGNTVIDALLWGIDRVDENLFRPAGDRRLILMTAHRRENFGEPLERICKAVRELVDSRDVEVLYPVHPNPNVVRVAESVLAGHAGVRLVAPLDYPRLLAAMKAADLILTDSGGIQEEAPSLGKPVLVLRDQTERPEGVEAGTARLVGTNRRAIVRNAQELLDDEECYAEMAQARNPYGDGHAAELICRRIASYLG